MGVGELASVKINDFPLIRKSPRGGPSDSMIERAAARSCWGYHRLGSYHAFMRPGTDSLIFSMMDLCASVTHKYAGSCNNDGKLHKRVNYGYFRSSGECE